MLKTGLIGREQAIVSLSKSAKEMGSGSLEIFATPALCALMEAAQVLKDSSNRDKPPSACL